MRISKQKGEMSERQLAATAVAERELTPLERREQVIGQLILTYSDIIRDGRYDTAFNRLSHLVYSLRSVQFEVEQDQDQETMPLGYEAVELWYERV